MTTSTPAPQTPAASALARVATAVHVATGHRLPTEVLDAGDLIHLDPARLRTRLTHLLTEHPGRIRVTGPLDARLLLIEQDNGTWQAADLSGRPHRERPWPAWTHGHIQIADPDSWLSPARLDEQALYRLSRPRVLLAALYHPEHFPLPRFPLGISDLARAARRTLMGQVDLTDMQLGVTLQDLQLQIAAEPYDILGISATFGQHDLMIGLLEAVYRLPVPPLVIAGGSLTARNERLLLEQFPNLLIARAAGEATITGLLHHWHGDTQRRQVPGLGHADAPRGGALAISQRRTAKPGATAAAGDILPELDLLAATLASHGVAQMEASRGCTNYCSFCPRGHKGAWSGAGPEQVKGILREISGVFDQFPHVSRTLYLVDEEFIGRGPDAEQRALAMADALTNAGFAWESSCRVDQVARSDSDHRWHIQRALMWRTLLQRGLRRMLFGVESGVDSILDRFNKETTGAQNALAIRTLSALGVPTRFTYITFDHLMTLQELKDTYAYQGRTDLLLTPQPHLSPAEIVAGVRDEDFVAAHTTGRPLHTAISYMLVSMECLIGAAYTHAVGRAGLTGEADPAMGRVRARFADWRIGITSEWSQRWVDRNFALDYTLKSLEKVLDEEARHQVRTARTVLKDAAYILLGQMIDAIDSTPVHGTDQARRLLETRTSDLLDQRIDALRDPMDATLTHLVSMLPRQHAATLHKQHQRWRDSGGWSLINAAGPCGS
ncbi:B12-binding domain-containing radical SAM protein [Actinomadura viridis]|uniref:B12-binding domain-containing radical SAM protein n=1 Tax=Actinomadura viridis TaxID=58110 RepID=UPI0036777F9F